MGVCCADAVACRVPGLVLGLGFAVSKVLRDGGLPASLVVLVAFPVGGVANGCEQAGQFAASWAVFVGDSVARRIAGLGGAAYFVVGGGGDQAACAGGFDGAARAVVFDAQTLAFALAGGQLFDDLSGGVITGAAGLAAGADDGGVAAVGVVLVAGGLTCRVGVAEQVACGVVFKAAGAAQRVGLG